MQKPSNFFCLAMQGQVSSWNDSPLSVTSTPPREAHNTIQEGLVRGLGFGFPQVGGGQRAQRETDASRTLAFSPACNHASARGQTRKHTRTHTLALHVHSLTPLAYQRGRQYHPTCSAIYHCGPGTALQGLGLWTRWASQGEGAEFARTVEAGQSCIAEQRK